MWVFVCGYSHVIFPGPRANIKLCLTSLWYRKTIILCGNEHKKYISFHVCKATYFHSNKMWFQRTYVRGREFIYKQCCLGMIIIMLMQSNLPIELHHLRYLFRSWGYFYFLALNINLITNSRIFVWTEFLEMIEKYFIWHLVKSLKKFKKCISFYWFFHSFN